MEDIVYQSIPLIPVYLLLFSLPYVVVVITALDLFDIKHKAGYLLASFAAMVAQFILVPWLSTPAELVCNSLALLVPLLVFACDPMWRRLFTALVVLVAFNLAEIPAAIFWDDAVSVSRYSFESLYAGLDVHVLAGVLHACVLIVLSFGIHVAQRHITRSRTDRGALVFIWFMVVQLFFVCLIVVSVEMVGGFTVSSALGVSFVMLTFVLADVVYFILLDRYNRSIVEAKRAEVLQGELSAYLEQYREIEQAIAETARIRHDMRNQSSVIVMLLEQGETEKAREFLASLVGHMREGAAESSWSDCSRVSEGQCQPEGQAGIRQEKNVTGGGILNEG